MALMYSNHVVMVKNIEYHRPHSSQVYRKYKTRSFIQASSSVGFRLNTRSFITS